MPRLPPRRFPATGGPRRVEGQSDDALLRSLHGGNQVSPVGPLLCGLAAGGITAARSKLRSATEKHCATAEARRLCALVDCWGAGGHRRPAAAGLDAAGD